MNKLNLISCDGNTLVESTVDLLHIILFLMTPYKTV